MKMVVRTAEAVDAEAIAKVQVESWRAAYRGLMPDELLDGLDTANRAAAIWRQVCNGAGWATLVVEDGGAVLGFCHVCPARDADLNSRVTAELTAIYVDPIVWGRGCGRLLCERAVAEARQRGATSMALWVLEGNDAARGFYERLGFLADGAKKTDEGSRLPEVRYVKVLGGG
jgi:GNAT superfamily N-acetyltransferase